MKIISIILCIILGTILHFTYKLSKCNNIVGVFSATNESIWEHLKLSFFPIIIIGIIEYLFLGKPANNFVLGKLIASLFAMAFTIVAFYTYVGITGKDNFIADISIFIVSIILAQNISYNIMSMRDFNLEIFSVIIILGLIVLFGVFTTKPPRIPLFQDPIFKTYGSICKK